MRYLKWLFAIILTALLSGTAVAQTAPTVQTAPAAQTEPITEDAWVANYWNNTDLAGAPALTQLEETLNYNWGSGSPAANVVSANRFSARWTRTINVPAGSYRFDLTVDDGARLWVNGRLFIDAWEIQPAETYSGEIYLPGGNIPLEVEYFENTGLASIALEWAPVDTFTDRWQGEYFNNPDLIGNPDVIRDDAVVDFDWGVGSPAPGIIDPDTFSARWTRTVNLDGGQYRFTVTSDDGVRLWVNDILLIDQWHTQAPTTYQRELALAGGSVPIRVDYYENGGNAEIQLSWSRLHASPQPQPGNVIDETSTGFTLGGPAGDWHEEAEGYGGSLLWSRSRTESVPPYNWARWYPDLAPGVYDVSVYVPQRFSTTSQARYWVSHSGGYTMHTVDQSANGASWVSLGTFSFDGSGSDFVSLADVTFENEARLVAFDAVRWTSVDGESDTAVTVSPTMGSSGEAVTVIGSGFPPGEPIYLRLGWPLSEPFGQYGETVVGSDGAATFNFIVPYTEPDGSPLSQDMLVVLLITQSGASGAASFQIQ